MRLIIREYLSLLKESGELDRLLPDLLLSMSITPISRAQIGVRQAGVDVAAVGKHPDTKTKTIFLFLIKQGNMGRSDWNNGQQAVRPSLDEIKDVYIQNNISPSHKKLPIKVVVCTGGELKQDCQQDWTGYVKSNEQDGSLEFEFWGGDELAVYIEQYLFNENILPEELRSKFRKTLALLSDPDYDFSDYYTILDELLLKPDFGDIKKTSTKNKIIKTFRTVNLCQNIIFFWAKSENNIRPAICCSERTVLNSWDIIRRYEINDNKKILSTYLEIYQTLLFIYNEYAKKVQPHCSVRNGFSGYAHDYLLECLTIFENLGFLSNAGLIFLEQGLLHNNDQFLDSSKTVKEMLKNFISNQKASKSPCYDGHIIEISQAIYLLAYFKEVEFIKNWIYEIINSVSFSYFRMNKYFPIHSDNFDDLVELNSAEDIDKNKLFELSTLLPILAQWSLALGFDDIYTMIQNLVAKDFPNCTLQIWYPDDDTDSLLYSSNAANGSGNTEAPLFLEDNPEEMKSRIKLVQERTIPLENISSAKTGLLYLPILASRHFRTPMLPIYWQAELVN